MKENKILIEVDTLNNKAWEINRDDPEKAIQLSEKAIKIAETGGYELGLSRAKHNMGMCLGWLSDFDQALKLTENSLKTFIKLDSYNDCGRNLYSIATIYYYKGDYKKAKEGWHESLKNYEIALNKVGITNAYNGLGSAYTSLGNFKEANKYLSKGLELSLEIDEFKIRPKLFHGLATAQMKQKDFEKAKEYFEQDLKLPKKTTSKQHRSFTLEGIGECYMNLGDFDKALTYLNDGLSLARELGLKFAEANALQMIGMVHVKTDDLKEGEKHLKQAYKLAAEIEGKGIIMSIHKSLSKLYELKKDIKNFTDHLRKYYKLKEELISEEQLKEQNYRLEKAYLNTKVLSEIGQEISSSLSLHQISEKVYGSLNSIMDTSNFAIGVFNKKKNTLDFDHSWENGKKLHFHSYDINDESRPGAYCFRNAKEVIIRSYEKDLSKYVAKYLPPAAGEQTESIIYYPLISKGKTLGVITVQSFKKNAYSEQHLDIVKNLATPIATALENALLYKNLESQIEERTKKVTQQKDELEQTYENTRILNEIGREITMSLSTSDVIEHVYKHVNDLMDASVFSIGIYDKKKRALVFKGAIEKGVKFPEYQQEIKDKNKMSIWCFLNQKECLINDVDKDFNKYIKDSKPPKASFGEAPESAIFLPLSLKEQHIGVLTIQSFKKNAYSKYQIDMLRNLALNISGALENAMMYGKMEEEVQKRTKEIENSYKNTQILNEIGQEINSSLSIKEIVEKVYKSLNSIMDTSNFGIGIYSEEKNIIEFDDAIENGKKLPYHYFDVNDNTRPGVYCFKNKTEVIIDEWAKDVKKYVKKSLPPAAGEQTESIIYFPLLSKGKTLGVITVQSFKKKAYSSYHLDLVKNLATPIATALENALLYENLEDEVKDRTNEFVKEKEKAEFEREEAKYQRRRAEQSERFKQQFLANMSHEIRTPMNAIMGMTNLILEKEPKEAHVSYLNTIKHSSESLLVIINDILDLSKIEAGKMELEHVDFNLEEVINLIERTLSHRAEERGLILSVAFDDQIPKILVGDSVRLQQVLMNIAGNAIKFTEKGGVSISANLEGGMLQGEHAKVRFEIRDTGIGMTRDQQNRVFENFSQASSDTTRKYGGTGLGLSISSKLVELFGSSIKLESEVNQGSTFHFVVNFEVSDNQLFESSDKSVSDDMIKELSGLNILIAEDNEYNRIVATETLELKIPNVKVECAINGEEAVKMAESNAKNIDIILMDVQMPVMDGFDATRNIRKSKKTNVNSLPIVALTASVIKTDIQKCFDAGMNGYIPKPFRTSELIESIYQAVKNGGNKDDFEKYIEKETVQDEPNNKLTHLSFLQEFTEGDTARMKKYVQMYLDSANSNIPKLMGHLEKKQYDQLRVLTHSMKPHFDFMGMHSGRELAEKIEQMINDKADLNKLPKYCKELEQMIDQSIKELSESLKSL